jgi:hypothetical protein
MRAPFRYSGADGPATLVMVQAAAGERRTLPRLSRLCMRLLSASVAAA